MPGTVTKLRPKRIRAMTDGQLADEYGELDAARARIKDEVVRRNIRRCEGDLFRLTVSPPGTSMRLDTRALETAYGIETIAQYRFPAETGWTVRCTARKAGGI